MRIVIKVGTSTLTHPTGRMNIRRVEQLCKVISDLKNAGHEIVLVSSGAIAMGVGKLGLLKRPQDMPTKQAAAADAFVRGVDSAAVYVNASTRFTDGGDFGLGCEMGISTQKLHARGPMGLRELTTYKYIIHGNGQIR